MSDINVPFDLYDGTSEILILVPLGGVDKKTVTVSLKNHKILIEGIRQHALLKDGLKPAIKKCFRGNVSLSVDLPNNIFYDKIHSRLTDTNILEIIIPKMIIPDKVKVDIE